MQHTVWWINPKMMEGDGLERREMNIVVERKWKSHLHFTKTRIHFNFFFVSRIFLLEFSRENLELIGSVPESQNRPRTNIMISNGWILLTSCVWYWPVIPTVRNPRDLCRIERRISSTRCHGSTSCPLKGVKSPLSSALIDRHVFERKSRIGPLWYKPSFLARFSSV